jgi:hypothetical protein
LVFVSAASSCGPWRSKSSCSSGLNLLGSVVRGKSLKDLDEADGLLHLGVVTHALHHLQRHCCIRPR